jgi:hypothetical protein
VASCFAGGAADAVTWGVASLLPHFLQNDAPGLFTTPHAQTGAARLPPHISQKAASSSFGALHCGQARLPPTVGEGVGRRGSCAVLDSALADGGCGALALYLTAALAMRAHMRSLNARPLAGGAGSRVTGEKVVERRFGEQDTEIVQCAKPKGLEPSSRTGTRSNLTACKRTSALGASAARRTLGYSSTATPRSSVGSRALATGGASVGITKLSRMRPIIPG